MKNMINTAGKSIFMQALTIYLRKSHIRESYDQVVDNRGNERHATYERYSIPSSYAGYKNSENVNINDIDSKSNLLP